MSAPESARAIYLQPFAKEPRVRPQPPLRREITSFSPASRRRLLWCIGQIAEPILNSALFLTLTYPKADSTCQKRERHLDSLLKRLRRKAPEASAIWKLEYTKENTPHYHLLILNLNFWHHAEIARAWSEIVKSENPHHQEAGTRIERVLSKKHIARYIVKYVSKTGPLPADHKGRVWGKVGPIEMAFSPKRIYQLTREMWCKVRRLLDQVRKSHKRNSPFRRQANIFNAQRWYAQGSEVIRLCDWLRASPIAEVPP